MPHSRAVLFDFDGVFVNSLTTAFDIIKTNHANLTLADYRARFEGSINETINFNKPLPSADQKSATFFDAFAPRLLQLPLVPNMPAVITALATDYALYIVSSTVSSAIADFLKHHQLHQHFAQILGNDVAQSKVKKFEMILAETGLAPTQCIFITDTLGDIREAKEVGIASIAVTWGYHDAATLQRGEPLALVSHPSEIVPAVTNFFEKSA